MHADRVVVGADDAGRRRAGRRALPGIDCPVLITDVASAEMIKYASNAFLATKISFINEIANVCEATGADVTRGRRGDGPGQAHRAALPAGRHRLRRQLLPQGRLRPQADRRQLRLPLPAAERRDRGQRAAEAPGDRQAQAPPGRRTAGQAHRPAGPGLQAQHRRHPRGLLHRPGRPAAGRRRPGGRVRSRRHGEHAGPASHAWTTPRRPWTALGAPTPACW